MMPINAIAKVRFSSAKAQRVHLVQDGSVLADLLCLESGQDIRPPAGTGLLYVVTGTAVVACPEGKEKLAPGQLLALGAGCTVTNASDEQRLVVLVLQAAAE